MLDFLGGGAMLPLTFIGVVKMTYIIKKLPACVDWKGNVYSDRFGLVMIDNLGWRWDGGEYATRDEAETIGRLRARNHG